MMKPATKLKKICIGIFSVAAVLLGTTAMAEYGASDTGKRHIGAKSLERLSGIASVSSLSTASITRQRIGDTVRKRNASCPDPAAKSIDVKILKRTAPDHRMNARVRIKGVVKNRGKQYQSQHGQQVAKLYENDRVVAETVFGSLNPKEEVYVKYDRRWSASTEFPPTYKLAIEYDPDISIDGNPMNDDCRMGNNHKSLSGTAISDLIVGRR